MTNNCPYIACAQCSPDQFSVKFLRAKAATAFSAS